MPNNQSLSPAHYHASSRFLHWLMAGLILYMIFQGWSLEEKDTLRATRYMIHKSIGITLLVLVMLRIGLRLVYKAPDALPMPKHQAMAAKAAHFGFYALMIGLPLSGWATVSTSEILRPTILYNLVTLPHLPLPREFYGIYSEAHHFGAKLIIYGLVPLHLAAALYHHFKTKDETLSHMIKGLSAKDGWQKQMRGLWLPIMVLIMPLVLATFLFKGDKVADVKDKAQASASFNSNDGVLSQDLVSASMSASEASAILVPPIESGPVVWNLAPADVRIDFETAYMGEAIKGRLPIQKAQIIFDPNKLNQANIKIIIALQSVNTGDSDRDQTLIGPDFFDTKAHPTALFEAKKIDAVGKNSYQAKGFLTLKGKKLPHVLNFQLKIDGDKAVLDSQSSIDRLSYGIGTGEFADPNAIPKDVRVSIKLKATRG